MLNHLDNNDLFGEIKMYRDSGERKDYVFILVEAKSDEDFYQKAITAKTIYFYGKGWENVEKIIQQVNKFQTKGVIGIIDADFKRIEKVEILKNLFLTDFHDKEMMLLHSPAWKGVLQKYSDNYNRVNNQIRESRLEKFEKLYQKSTLEILLEVAKPIADIRLLNERQNHTNKLTFKTKSKKTKKSKKEEFDYIKYDTFIDQKTLKVDKQKLQKAVENKSQKQGFFNNPIIQNQLKTIEGEEHDLSELCNGHDVINIFCLALEKAIANESAKRKEDRISTKQIEENLTIAYRFEDFQTTNLYIDLLSWEKENVPYKLFK